MKETRIQISSVLEGQLPEFVREEFPLVSEFLTQYYLSLENQGGVTDILQNIDQYIKVDNLTNLTEFTYLNGNVSSFDSDIIVDSTYGFPDRYGLLLIDGEIITYTQKTLTSFIGCIRGFSGITSYKNNTNTDQLVFSESNANDHSTKSIVQNLSILFLKEFFKKIKKQIVPGFQDREFYSGLNDRLFVKQAKDFYSSKGTDNSFEILFRALYGKDVEVIKPRDFIIQPSDAQYSISKNLIVEAISGNPLDLENTTLYQDYTGFFDKARGTIVHTEKIRRGYKDYYILNLDYSSSKDIDLQGTILGEFSIHPKTQTTELISADSTVLNVDSTIGFPNSGTLNVTLSNSNTISIGYSSKTVTQFLNCTNISQEIPAAQEVVLNAYAYGYVGNDKTNIVKVRVTGVLSDLEIKSTNQYYNKGDIVKIRTLGKDLDDYKSNNWIFNIPTKYEVKSISIEDSSTYKYAINLYDDHNFFIGDSITLIGSDGSEKSGNVILTKDSKSFLFRGQSELDTSPSYYYTARKNISKVTTNNYPLEKYQSNIQNVYTDLNNSLYIASPSLPSYFDNYSSQSLEINDRSIKFSGIHTGTDIVFAEKHGFYTGDSVVYSGDVISPGIYFIKKVDDTTIKIANSRSSINTNNFISIDGNITSGKFTLTDFCYDNLGIQVLEPQKLLRKLSEPENDSNIYETKPGLTGIFINGVELLNYKSKDNINYGPIESIAAVSPGFGYDVINPPLLTINDSVGSGASVYCWVTGELERIDIIDPGFDYLEEPVISITGGNGYGASAKTKLVSFDYSIDFNSQQNFGLVNLTNNTIAFSTYHKFRDVEEITYSPNGQKVISGLSTNSTYFVSLQDAYTIKLHNSFKDASSKTNAIDLTDYGIGNHTLKSSLKKKKIGSIYIENPGFSYQNKKTSTTSVGIDTAADIINIKNHGYNSGEIISYTPSSTPISGLTASSYYVTVVNENQFKLSQIGFGTVGLSTEVSDFYYQTKQYINLTSQGDGNHIFNYQPINVSITGRIGVSSINPQNFNAILQPIFRGKIESVFIENGGDSYGSADIINYDKQPQFLLNSGSGAQITPIIINGVIVDIIINSTGFAYNAPPNLDVQGDGVGAILTPIISNGTLISVKIISGGVGYTVGNTFITVFSAGKGANFYSKVKSWKINLVQRLIQSGKITADDGVLSNGINPKLGLQYTHAYSPRNLRKIVLGKKISNGSYEQSIDLDFKSDGSGREEDSIVHSPILGWAYDGNPIYGPYGYKDPSTRGNVKSMLSGYKEVQKSNRPSDELYPIGFFVDDYEYQNDKDLDEYNGRFCVTPEYPNGIYAYFCTIGDIEENDSNSPFGNYKIPVFPYVIGNFYKSKPIDFNFLISSNQDDFDFKSFKLLRNTTPYNLYKEKSGYDYILNPNDIHTQLTEIKNSTSGSIKSIEVVNGGYDYKVGDSIILDTKSSGGRNARAKVSSVEGKEISQISVASSLVSNVEFIPLNNSQNFVGFASFPHNFLNNDLVTITTPYENKKSSNIIVQSNILTLRSGIGSAEYTGIVTYFNVSGFLDSSNIKENDIYQIQNEQIKILNIDPSNSRIRVLRNYNGTSGLSTYNVGFALTEKTRKVQLNFGISSTSYQYNLNRELYFNPKESVGLGTTSGVGIVSTIYFSNYASGISSIKIPTQAIYLPNHNFNTGDSLIYSSNGGDVLAISTNGKSSSNLTNKSIVYVAKISNDLIGISTFKVGLGSTGSFVGIGTTRSNMGILYFTGIGTGVYHSFTTRYKNILSGQISKNVVTVSIASSLTTGLSVGDSVNINVKSGITTTIVIKYNDYNRRLVINPKSFISSDVDIENNTIKIKDHNFKQSQKIIHTSSASSGGLLNEKIYYVIVMDSDTIKLSETLYSTKKLIPDEVNITSPSFGTISQINPPLNIFKNQIVFFDVSDSSLAFRKNSANYTAFDLNFYSDVKFKNKLFSSSSTSSFEVKKFGDIGKSSAYVSLSVNDNIPNVLYYRLEPVNIQNNTSVKKEIIIDEEQLNFNKLNVVSSGYNGSYNVVAISSNAFNYNILNLPEKTTYSSGEGDLKYYTSSSSSYGPIHSVDVISKGNDFSTLPGISTIKSENGNSAILRLIGDGIGKINKKEILDIGFDYSCDYTIRPIAKLPTIVKIDPFYSFESIGIDYQGKNYNISPDLVVLDGFTGKVVNDVILDYQVGNTQVEILKNTKGLYNATPRIIPINNSNGIGISSITFDSMTKNVTVTLSVGFSTYDAYPFAVNDKVLIENISVGVGSTGKGYNSDRYNYSLFTLTSIDPNIAGSNGTVVYNMSDYLSNNEVPGNWDQNGSFGTITPEKYFPKFNSILKQNSFYDGETILSNYSDSRAVVQKINESSEYLKMSTGDTFKIGDSISGNTSFTKGTIIEILPSEDCIYDVEPFSIVKNGWKKETGFLSDNLQRIHDNDYYQYFSYSLKSEISFDTWSNPVSDLNHSAGFKKFSDLIIESDNIGIGTTSTPYAGLSTFQDGGDFTGICDLSRFIDLNCVNDFDFVREVSFKNDTDNNLKSNEIIFNSVILQDYIEAIGNRVLSIDDISNSFNSEVRIDKFTAINTFELYAARSRKYLTYVVDDTNVDEKQVSFVTFLHNDSNLFLNQYAVVPTKNYLGFFNIVKSAAGIANLTFNPYKYETNNYTVNYLSYDMQDILPGISADVNLGDVAKVSSGTTSLIASSIIEKTKIVGINSTYRASKVLVKIGAIDGSYYQYDELTVIHDDTNANLLQYGQLTTDTLSEFSSVGLGTYNAYLSGSYLNIDFTPNSPLTVDYTVVTIATSIANTSSVAIGKSTYQNHQLSSDCTHINSPTLTGISTYDNRIYGCAYYIVSVEDTTNKRYQVSEVLVVDNNSLRVTVSPINACITEFGVIQTYNSLGTISADTSTTKTTLYFTPISGISAQVRVFQHSLGFAPT